MDGHDNVVLVEAINAGDVGVENLDDRLHLQIVVARSECAHLAALALPGALRNAFCGSAGHLAGLFDAFEVARFAPSPSKESRDAIRAPQQILRLARLRLRGPNGAKDEFLLAAPPKPQAPRPLETNE